MVTTMTHTPIPLFPEDAFKGTIHVPGSLAYDEARQIWNGQIDRRPALIATCVDTDDVATAVRYAVASGTPLSVRGGGHHVAGSAIVEAGLVIDLSQMSDVTLSPDKSTALVQGGAKLGNLDRGMLPFGRLVPAGIDHDTGVGGLTLGGGIGWTSRRHGLTSDNLTGVTMVTAAGEILHVDEASDPELMWGLRGGGGNFGIVTSFEFATHPLPDKVLAGFAVYDGTHAADVLRRYRSVVAHVPDEITTIVFLRSAPEVPWMPEEVLGKPVVMIGVVYMGDPDAAEAVVAPFRTLGTPIVDTIQPKPMIEHQAVLEGANPVGHRYYWKSTPIRELSGDVIDTFHRHLQTISSPHSLLGFFQLGGAVARNRDFGCFPNREARFLVNYAVHWIDPSEDGLHRDWTRQAMAEIEPHSSGGGYVNFLADQGIDAVRAAYGDDRYLRLVALKHRMDPTNVFRHNQNIPPS